MNVFPKKSRAIIALLGLCLAFDANGSVALTDAVSSETGPEGFRMEVADVIFLSGTGLLAVGIIGAGEVAIGDTVCLASGAGPLEVGALEQFNKLVERAGTGEQVGLLFPELAKGSFAAGETLLGCD